MTSVRYFLKDGANTHSHTCKPFYTLLQLLQTFSIPIVRTNVVCRERERNTRALFGRTSFLQRQKQKRVKWRAGKYRYMHICTHTHGREIVCRHVICCIRYILVVFATPLLSLSTYLLRTAYANVCICAQCELLAATFQISAHTSFLYVCMNVCIYLHTYMCALVLF